MLRLHPFTSTSAESGYESNSLLSQDTRSKSFPGLSASNSNCTIVRIKTNVSIRQ
jgi:hypothetical protein